MIEIMRRASRLRGRLASFTVDCVISEPLLYPRKRHVPLI